MNTDWPRPGASLDIEACPPPARCHRQIIHPDRAGSENFRTRVCLGIVQERLDYALRPLSSVSAFSFSDHLLRQISDMPQNRNGIVALAPESEWVLAIRFLTAVRSFKNAPISPLATKRSRINRWSRHDDSTRIDPTEKSMDNNIVSRAVRNARNEHPNLVRSSAVERELC